MADPVQFIRGVEPGTRVVVRSRIEGGFTDALGYLRSLSDTECVIETMRGLQTIALNDITAAKTVPPPPPRRAPRFPLS